MAPWPWGGMPPPPPIRYLDLSPLSVTRKYLGSQYIVSECILLPAATKLG